MKFQLSAARLHLQRVAHNFLPVGKNIVYSYSAVTTHLGTNALGYRSEHDPFTGTVVDVQDLFGIVQTSEKSFVFVESAVLRAPLVLGQRISVTPYARRRFDGTRVKDPVAKTTTNGQAVAAYGSSVSHFPVDGPISELGQHLLDTLARMRCPDGVRVLSNFLVDLGASNFVLLEPDPDRATHPADLQLVFDCSASNFTGRVTVGLEQGLDLFYVQMHQVSPDGPETLIHNCQSINFDSVAEVLTTLLCDGQWQYAQVEVLQTASEEVAA